MDRLGCDTELGGDRLQHREGTPGIEVVVAGRDRCVRREDDARRGGDTGLVEAQPMTRHQRSDPGEGDERGMTFVQVHDGRLRPERGERAIAGEREDDVLEQPGFGIARVQASPDRPIGGRVARDVGVEEQEPRTPDARLPDAYPDRPVRQRGGDDDREPEPIACERHGQVARRDRFPGLVLAAVGVQPLVRCLAVSQSDPDGRDTQRARRLQGLAGDRTEAARGDRQAVRERELRCKQTDAQRSSRICLAEPALGPRAERVELTDDGLQSELEVTPRDCGTKARGRELLQEPLGVVPRRLPPFRVEVMEQLGCFRVPRPSKITSQPLQRVASEIQGAFG